MPPENQGANPEQIINDPNQEPAPALKQIRTFQGDIAEALKRQQESLVSIQRREHIKHGPPVSPEQVAANKKRVQFFYLLMGSLVLFVLGGVGAWYGYQEFVRRTVAPIVAGPANRFISPSTSTNLDLANLSREMLITHLIDATINIPDGELRHINLRKAQASTTGTPTMLKTDEFLKILQSRAPGILVRALNPLFMFGALGTNSTTTRASTFLIIKLDSFDNAFAGMLEWEQNMNQDIGVIFSTAPLLQTLPAGTTFTDLTDRNKDMRILSLAGEPIMLYSFFEGNMLIITDRLETMRTIVEQLVREKLSR